MATGTVTQVIGPSVDVQFPAGALPTITHALRLKNRQSEATLILEVAQHIGDNTVRCIAMSSTDGLTRGMPAEDLGSPISVPVGPKTLGRIFNLLGEPIDEQGDVPAGTSPCSSIGSPRRLKMRPSVFGPTGTEMGLPRSSAGIPRVSPSVEDMAMHRTVLSPMCWATSRMSVASDCRFLRRSAWVIVGRAPAGNWTSTLGPITWVTVPVAIRVSEVRPSRLPRRRRSRTALS